MQVNKRLRSLATAVLFVATCAVARAACLDGGPGYSYCSETRGFYNPCTISCNPGYYACCNVNGQLDNVCSCISYSE